MVCVLLAFATMPAVRAQVFQVDTVVYNGDPGKFINFVFLGDGYPEQELDGYARDVRNMSNYLFSVPPFREYRNYFNVFAIRVPSAESGASHPLTAPDCPSPGVHPQVTVNTYFGSRFDVSSIHRLLVAQNTSAINAVTLANFPGFDQRMMIVNTPFYGGSGGATAATTSLAPSAFEILVHEIGHSFANLADEYYAGDQFARERANMTRETDPALVKWSYWMGTGGVGIYQHCCSGNSALWYKPHQSCKMQFLGQGYPFCPVCREAFVERIHQLFGSPVLSRYPDGPALSHCGTEPLPFRVSAVAPVPNTLRMTWRLNGAIVASNVDSILLTTGGLTGGSNLLELDVLDTTFMVRDPLHASDHAYSLTWTIQYGPCTGIGNGTYLGRLMLRPNPARETVFLDLPSGGHGQLHVEVHDASGRLVADMGPVMADGGGTLDLPLGGLETGSYTMRVLGQGGLVLGTGRFIKQD